MAGKMITGCCLHCRKGKEETQKGKREFEAIEFVKANNNATEIGKRKCPTCGGKITGIVSKKEKKVEEKVLLEAKPLEEQKPIN